MNHHRGGASAVRGKLNLKWRRSAGTPLRKIAALVRLSVITTIVFLAHPARAGFALYASSSGNNAIYKFNAGGQGTLFATNSVNGVLDVPLGLALDSVGNLPLCGQRRQCHD